MTYYITALNLILFSSTDMLPNFIASPKAF